MQKILGPIHVLLYLYPVTYIDLIIWDSHYGQSTKLEVYLQLMDTK